MRKMKILLLLFSCLFMQQVFGQSTSTADELLKLKKLYDQGVLTKEEFDSQKAKLLGANSNSKANVNITTVNNENSGDISIPEAEFSGVVVYVNNNTPVELESSRMSEKTRVGAAVFLTGGLAGKAKVSASVKGAHSKVTLKPKNNMQFIYTAENNSINPTDVIILYKFLIHGDERRIEMASAGMYGNVNAGTNDNMIPIQARKYGKQSYLITVNSLPPGEYGFVFGTQEKKATSTIIRTFSIE